jgi:hypothetical protein
VLNYAQDKLDTKAEARILQSVKWQSYELNKKIGVLFRREYRYFLSLYIQTSSGVHSVSYPKGTGGVYVGYKSDGT